VARRAVERGPRFRKLVKWRTGSEGRISALKRSWGWSRSFMDGLAGTQIWCGYGIFAKKQPKNKRAHSRKETPNRCGGTAPPTTHGERLLGLGLSHPPHCLSPRKTPSR
jgi:hypothetical protein